MTVESKDVVQAMQRAATALVEALDDEQRVRMAFEFGDEEERRSWAYFPRDHHGLPLHAMDMPQRKLVHALIASALSLQAHAKVSAIMALETVLARIEGNILSPVRDPARYFVSIFGAPGGETWGWRLEGHHVVLNFTVAGDAISSTPIFLGANPAEVHGVMRPCGDEEDVARKLLRSLGGEQRQRAIIADTAPPDFVLANLPVVPDVAVPGDAVPSFMMKVPAIKSAWDALPAEARTALRFEREAARGLSGSDMNHGQRSQLYQVICTYIGRLTDDLAIAEMKDRFGVPWNASANATAGRLEDIHFAWAGSAKRNEGHYYRIQGPKLLIEYDNTQDDANHVHAVWRDPDGDFGDALRTHLRTAH